MGDAFVSALVKELASRLTSEAIKEFGLLWGFQDDVLALKDDFHMIAAVLQDAEEKRSKEEAVKLWLQRLRSASLEVENVLDDISTEALLQRLYKQRGMKHRVSAFFSSNHNPFMFRVRAAHKVKAIRRKLDAIASRRYELKLTPSSDISHVDVDVADEMLDRETSSFIHDSSIIFGRDEEMEMVTKAICNQDVGSGEVPVYSIWGMGGLGKTTLAQLVYNHETVKQCFDLKCWIYVSEKFQVKEIMKKIITSLEKQECTLTPLDVLQESLQNKLGGKKFLIVLDDVWVEDDENEKSMWEKLRKTLRCGADGSIVVMTTRSQATSQMYSKVPKLQHKLGCLSRDDSWSLFKKLAFAPGRERDNINELVPIGREIVEKCKGLPLAVKTLGSLMWSKSSTSDWLHVKENNIWDLDDVEVEILPSILKLSYDKLLPHLKRCFTYCCLFPKGCEMRKDILISLWAANGFIPPKGGKDLYMLGEEILNCFVWRSFLQVVKPGKYGDGIYRYKMHDLMHDMAHDVMGQDCLVIERASDEVQIPNGVLHLSSSCPVQFPYEDLGKLTSLRSIFTFRGVDECSKNFQQAFLRVLHMDDIRLMPFPESGCKLKHLKYLNLSNSRIQVLPESIMYLQNLEYLNLSSSSIQVLPESIMYLQNLQYLNLSRSLIEFLPEWIVYLQKLQMLYLDHCFFLPKLPDGLKHMRNLHCLNIHRVPLKHFPVGIKELTSLRTLSRFPVGKENGAKIGELGDLNLLEGEFWLEQLENVGSLGEAKSAKLQCKRNILDLHLTWTDMLKGEREERVDEEVLEGLEPNLSLKKLAIFNYMGMSISPGWLVNLKKLVEIKFYKCNRCEHIPTLGRLPNLRVIKLSYMDSFKCFVDDDTNMLGDTTNMFLSVEELDIKNCRSLVSLPSNLPKLKVLQLYNCDALVSLPDEIQSFKDLKELAISYCEQLKERYEMKIGTEWSKISHIPNVSFW